MKKQISFILVICMLFMELTFKIDTIHAETFGIYTYTINNGEVTITYCDRSASGSVEIPDTVDGHPVTVIDSYAFSGCESLTSITIPDGVTSIGNYAFEDCSSLIEVHISDIAAWCNISFKDVFSNPLYYAENLYLNNELVCNLVIPKGVTSISNYAFRNCSSLTSITIPDSVTSIGYRAFEYCYNLREVHISDIAAWCNISFDYYGFNPLYYAENLYLNNELVKDLVIPEGVTSISDYAFRNCSSLTSITIPDSVTSIGYSAFEYCYNLREVHISDIVAWCNISFGNYGSNPLSYAKNLYLNNELVNDLVIPDGVTSISNYEFQGFTGLTSITIPDSVASIGRYAFEDCTGLTSITIPDSVTSIGGYAFYNCTGLTSITIPGSVTSIGNDAFMSCTGLTSITIPNSVTSIGNDVFMSCTGLTSITIPNSVTSIGDYAFYNCIGLKSVTIPNSVTSIGYRAFDYCSSLTNIYYEGTQEEWSKITIGSYAIPEDVQIHYFICATGVSLDSETLNLTNGNEKLLTAIVTPENATNKNIIWSSSNDKVATVKNGFVTANGAGTAVITATTEDGNYTASCTVSVKDYTAESDFQFINGTITKYIGEDTDVIVPKTIFGTKVIKIGEYAFSDCSINSISVPHSVEIIENNAFANSGLKDLYYDGTSNDWKKVSVADNAIPENVIIHYYVGVTSISLDKTKINTSLNKAEKLTAVVEPDDSFNKKVLWTSSDECVATVKDGIITPISLGQTIITATAEDGGAYASCTVTVCTDPSLFKFNNGTITGFSGEGNVIIPDTINDIPVTCIGSYAFSNCTGLTSITIPGSVTGIADYAFKDCSNLESITIPNSVTSIGNYAFYNCSSLESVTIPNSVTSISNYAFQGCSSLESITIPDSVTSIGNSAFYNCSSLESITIPNSVTSIGNYAFDYCSSLESVTIPNSITCIGNYMFSNCYKLKMIVIPNSVKEIGDYAFQNCRELTNIIMSDQIVSIGNCSFNNCSSLTSITIPKSVTNIKASAFGGCSSLGKVYISDISAWCNISFDNDYSNPLSYAKNLYLNNELVSDLIIPEGITSINSNTFQGYNRLISVEIPNSVKSIDSYAFNRCNNLKSIKLGYGVADINENAFKNCNSIEKIILNKYNTYYTLHDDVLYNRSKTQLILYPRGSDKETLNMPNTVIKINNGVFEDCKKLKSLTISSSMTNIDKNTFSGCSGLTSVTIPDSVTSIGDYAFEDCSSLESITIPNSVTRIGNYAFNYCNSLKEVHISDIAAWCNISLGYSNFNPLRCALYLNNELVKDLVIPDSVTSIGDYAFRGFSGLTSITIPNSVASIGRDAFFNCTGLTSITIPDSVTSIGSYVFSNCTALESVILPKNITEISEGMFENCNALTNIIIPSSVTEIGGLSFKNCSALTNINIPANVVSIDTAYGSWGRSAPFSDCSNLTDISVDENNEKFSSENGVLFDKSKTRIIKYPEGKKDSCYEIPNGVKTIDYFAFYNCNNLTKVELPDTIENVGVSYPYNSSIVFEKCKNLSKIYVDENNNNYYSKDGVLFDKNETLVRYPEGSNKSAYSIPDGVVSIGDYAFGWCTNLTSVGIPDSVTSVGEGAFYDSSLSDVYYSGNEADKEKIKINQSYVGSYNNDLLNAAWHYESSVPNNTPTIKAANISSKSGEAVKMDIMLENNPGAAIIGFNIDYDGNVMELASVTNGKIFDDADILDGNLQKNPYIFTCMNSSENKTEDGVLISLTFNVMNNCPAGDYSINISNCEAYTINESKVDFTLVNGKITVSDDTKAVTNVSVNIPNYQKGGTVIAGLYDSSEKLLCVKSYTPAKTVNVSFEQSGAYVKIMHWNMDTMTPLAESQTIYIK